MTFSPSSTVPAELALIPEIVLTRGGVTGMEVPGERLLTALGVVREEGYRVDFDIDA